MREFPFGDVKKKRANSLKFLNLKIHGIIAKWSESGDSVERAEKVKKFYKKKLSELRKFVRLWMKMGKHKYIEK